MSLQFEFPADLTVENFIVKLGHEAVTQLVSRQSSHKIYYDSFDWRLYSNAISCELNQTKSGSSCIFKSIEDDQIIADSALKKIPLFAKEFEPGKIRDVLTPLLDMRALLPVCTLDCEIYHLNIINKDQKTILRLFIEEYVQFNSRVLLQPIRGYDKAAEQIVEVLTTTMGLKTVVDKSLLLTALQVEGRRPKDYSSKLNINLDPGMRADIAAKYIYSHLLKTIKVNEQGTIANTDSEFLHDFRVAVRRTRAGLSQIKSILPANTGAYYADFFSWLGQVTGPTRDLDVYLLNFEHYKSSLPESIREDLNPLYDFLLAKQQKAQKELAKRLQSAKYLSILAEWEQYLKEPSCKRPLEQNAGLTIKELADRRISKIFTRVLNEGEAITDLSPSEALHDLRKSCKKLRYLMEFFQSLYPEQEIRSLIKNLKELQDVLGDFQDYAVQEQNLKLFSEEMMALGTHANTFLAMGVLVQDLDVRKWRARKDFASRFEDFKQERNRAAFKSLFASSKTHSFLH